MERDRATEVEVVVWANHRQAPRPGIRELARLRLPLVPCECLRFQRAFRVEQGFVNFAWNHSLFVRFKNDCLQQAAWNRSP
jgi:hypothetical protein